LIKTFQPLSRAIDGLTSRFGAVESLPHQLFKLQERAESFVTLDDFEAIKKKLKDEYTPLDFLKRQELVLN